MFCDSTDKRKHTHTHTHTYTDGHEDYMTDLAKRAESVKIEKLKMEGGG